MHTVERELVSDAIRSIVLGDSDYLNIVWSIEEFNKVFEVAPNPTLYAKLVVEEANEWQEDLLLNGWTTNLLKETTDILYVLEGLLAAHPDDPIHLDADLALSLDNALNYIIEIVSPFCLEYYTQSQIMMAFQEVHRSNLSKLDENGKPIRRKEDNKVLKGPNYTPADISGIILTDEEMVEIHRF